MKKRNTPLNQKLKGVAQQIKGGLEDLTGQHVKGKVDKVRGKFNEKVGDFRNRNR